MSPDMQDAITMTDVPANVDPQRLLVTADDAETNRRIAGNLHDLANWDWDAHYAERRRLEAYRKLRDRYQYDFSDIWYNDFNENVTLINKALAAYCFDYGFITAAFLAICTTRMAISSFM